MPVVTGAIADLIQQRAGKTGPVRIDEYLNNNGPGCETCGYGGEPDCDITIYVGSEKVYSVTGVEATLLAVSEWLNGGSA